jgi:hypothetical protein
MQYTHNFFSLAPAGVGSCVIRSSCDVFPACPSPMSLAAVGFGFPWRRRLSSSLVGGLCRYATSRGRPASSRTAFDVRCLDCRSSGEEDEWLAASFPACRCLPIPELNPGARFVLAGVHENARVRFRSTAARVRCSDHPCIYVVALRFRRAARHGVKTPVNTLVT